MPSMAAIASSWNARGGSAADVQVVGSHADPAECLAPFSRAKRSHAVLTATILPCRSSTAI